MTLKNIPFGTAEQFNVVVEIPKGSEIKYQYDEILDVMKVDWVFQNGFCFPFNYGYIPQTKAGDGDTVDVFILNDKPIAIGTIIECRPIGIIELLDRGKEDNKILAVPITDRAYRTFSSIEDLPKDYETILREFFKELEKQKNKVMEIKGFYNRARAIEEIKLRKI